MKFYKKNDNLEKILPIINGESMTSLRVIDWFVTNYAKKYFTVYNKGKDRFKVYIDYKLKLKAYSKKRFDPFCRWDRINIPYKNETYIQTTIGQLNFFRWSLENDIIKYVEENMDEIKQDQEKRNSITKNNKKNKISRKRREELSVCASKSIKKEKVEIVVKFD